MAIRLGLRVFVRHKCAIEQVDFRAMVFDVEDFRLMLPDLSMQQTHPIHPMVPRNMNIN
jgi:hypothetical protein